MVKGKKNKNKCLLYLIVFLQELQNLSGNLSVAFSSFAAGHVEGACKPRHSRAARAADTVNVHVEVLRTQWQVELYDMSH